MRRVHCATCMCADDEVPFSMDPHAPFFELVVLVDRLSNRQQRETYKATIARHRAEEDADW